MFLTRTAVYILTVVGIAGSEGWAAERFNTEDDLVVRGGAGAGGTAQVEVGRRHRHVAHGVVLNHSTLRAQNTIEGQISWCADWLLFFFWRVGSGFF